MKSVAGGRSSARVNFETIELVAAGTALPDGILISFRVVCALAHFKKFRNVLDYTEPVACIQLPVQRSWRRASPPREQQVRQ
jgi:hypothetical protein